MRNMAKNTRFKKKRSRVVYRYARSRKRSRRSSGGGGGGINLLHIGAAAAALSFLGNNTSMGQTIAGKIPGNKTFGAGAALGITCLVLNMAKPNKWLKLAGVAGIVLAGSQLGVQGMDFKYVGDVGSLETGGGFQSIDGGDDDVGEYEDDELADYDDED